MLLYVIIFYMKKISKEELIIILKNKNNITYKELSIMTGYHEKSLIRINSLLKKNNYKSIKKKKTPSRYIDNSIKNNIIIDYKKGIYNSYVDIYNKYKNVVSYSYICKLLNNIKIDKEILIIAKVKENNKYYTYTIDYKNSIILYKLPFINNTISNLLLDIFNNYGIPNNIYCYNIKCNNNYLLKKYKINILYNLKFINNNIYFIIKDNKVINNMDIKYRKYMYSKDDFYSHLKRKVLKNNIIQFNNIRYKIISNYLIKYRQVVDVYYKEDMSDLYIKYNNKIYNLKKEKVVYSVKGLTKYN